MSAPPAPNNTTIVAINVAVDAGLSGKAVPSDDAAATIVGAPIAHPPSPPALDTAVSMPTSSKLAY